MQRKKRKIGFYYITVNEGNDLLESFNITINSIQLMDKKRKVYNLGSNKFCIIDSIVETKNNQTRIIFKSATHSYRPNLIHRDTIEERESPKEIKEGDLEKTHIVVDKKDGNILVVLEKHQNGINISQFIKYLNKFSLKKEVNFGFETIVKENFLEEINNMSRVTIANIVIDKQLLGGDALNYSNRITQVKHDVMLTVKAKNKDTIADFVMDAFLKFNSGDTSISKIRIVGRNEDNNEVVLNTDFIERQEYINPEINETTGELSTLDVFSEMTSVLESF